MLTQPLRTMLSSVMRQILDNPIYPALDLIGCIICGQRAYSLNRKFDLKFGKIGNRGGDNNTTKCLF